MSGLYLLARIAGTAVAIRTDEVEAVVRLREMSPVPSVAKYVVGLAALRSRVLTVVDAAAMIYGADEAAPTVRSSEDLAVVCEIGGHSYGILVESVDDIQTIDTPALPVCGRVDEVWRRYAAAVIEHEGQPYFILSKASFFEGFLTTQAAA